jgi:LEA14-like dessication related protein
MPINMSALRALFASAVLALSGCASMQGREPVQVFMVGVEPLQGQGLELRMMVKLRIQNPNDAPIDYNGIFVELDVQGKNFASGVSDASGTVPRFGEAVVDVPVSISAFRIARQAIGIATNEYEGKLTYELTGKLSGPAFRSVRYKSRGEFTLPAELRESGQ